MKYKMLVMDMDDTLLRKDHTISERTKKAIKETQEKGVKVVLASGRPDFAMKDYAKELELDKYKSYILSFNGARIIDCHKDEIIFEQSLKKEVAHELYEISKKENMFIHTYLSDDIITEQNNEYTEIEANITGMKIKTITDFKKSIKGNVIKVLMLEDPTYLKKVSEKLHPKLSDKLNMTISKPYFLEFMDKGIDKGETLKKLANKLNINIDEIIAVGDSFNDSTMIKTAGLGVAMGNAHEEIKEIADYITDTSMNDGVAKLIEKFILKK
ncbi:Cof-type HAD-IIB family hydrolase [Haliovirga abyssi]|uniref:Haloacid dehalogenase n=1 Tax=Haliovirga abyssi TaxID=2996794 RepID=A0AAU9DAF2_9FUSO|nr:Cof-type HAD-IIB family hydrolase [Haliovirga abyssi]BDU51618.1 haloacid dehalogenase [Haliovirga abyssi]